MIKVISARILVWTARRWLISVMAKFPFPIAHPIQCYNGPEASIRKASIYYVTISVIFCVFNSPSQPFEPYWPQCAWYCHSLFCFLYWEPVNKRDDVSERKKHWNFNHIIIFKVKEILSMYKSFQNFNFIYGQIKKFCFPCIYLNTITKIIHGFYYRIHLTLGEQTSSSSYQKWAKSYL